MTTFDELNPSEKQQAVDMLNMWFWVKRLIVVGLVFLIAVMGGCPAYKVYSQKMRGMADLKEAEQNRMILLEQAEAEKEAAIARAEAIKIVGEMAKQYPEYRYQEFLGSFAHALQNGDVDKLIFVPTEAQIPITEATRSVE